MSVLVASGWVRPMANQMPTPLTVPKTPVMSEEEAGVALELVHPVLAALAERLALGDRQEEASANGELGDHDMEDRDDGDHRTAA